MNLLLLADVFASINRDFVLMFVCRRVCLCLYVAKLTVHQDIVYLCVFVSFLCISVSV